MYIIIHVRYVPARVQYTVYVDVHVRVPVKLYCTITVLIMLVNSYKSVLSTCKFKLAILQDEEAKFFTDMKKNG